MWVGNGVDVGVHWGCEEKEKGEMQNILFGRASGIYLLFQGHAQQSHMQHTGTASSSSSSSGSRVPGLT